MELDWIGCSICINNTLFGKKFVSSERVAVIASFQLYILLHVQLHPHERAMKGKERKY